MLTLIIFPTLPFVSGAHNVPDVDDLALARGYAERLCAHRVFRDHYHVSFSIYRPQTKMLPRPAFSATVPEAFDGLSRTS